MLEHTFVICAYKESPYLEQCIISLKDQTVKSNIIMVTSTPNLHISSLAEKYDIPLFINTKEKGIAQDWNFAYAQSRSVFVTIAHQDDVYEKNYLKNIMDYVKKAKDPIILFTNYGELRDGKQIITSTLLKIKRLMLWPLKVKILNDKIWVRRLILRFGNPICCPSITYNKKKFTDEPFETKFSSNVDWMMLEKASKKTGEFCYLESICMFHRIHQESTTSEIIGNNLRWKEDYEMFCRFWPRFIAAILVKIYRLSEKSNNIDKDM